MHFPPIGGLAYVKLIGREPNLVDESHYYRALLPNVLNIALGARSAHHYASSTLSYLLASFVYSSLRSSPPLRSPQFPTASSPAVVGLTVFLPVISFLGSSFPVVFPFACCLPCRVWSPLSSPTFAVTSFPIRTVITPTPSRPA